MDGGRGVSVCKWKYGGGRMCPPWGSKGRVQRGIRGVGKPVMIMAATLFMAMLPAGGQAMVYVSSSPASTLQPRPQCPPPPTAASTRGGTGRSVAVGSGPTTRARAALMREGEQIMPGGEDLLQVKGAACVQGGKIKASATRRREEGVGEKNQTCTKGIDVHQGVRGHRKRGSSRQKRCKHPFGCRHQSTFGPEGGRALYCLLHKLAHHINLRSRYWRTPKFPPPSIYKHANPYELDDTSRICYFRQCEAEWCHRQPLYGSNADKVPRYCSLHKRASDHDLVHPRCSAPNCLRQPTFGELGSGSRSIRTCKAHKLAHYVDLAHPSRQKRKQQLVTLGRGAADSGANLDR